MPWKEVVDNRDNDNHNYCDEDNHFDSEHCKKTVCRSFDVSVPVTVTPFAVPKKPEVRCADKITICPGHESCEHKCNSLKFTITQSVDVNIPVKFGAEIHFDKTCAVDKGKCHHK